MTRLHTPVWVGVLMLGMWSGAAWGQTDSNEFVFDCETQAPDVLLDQFLAAIRNGEIADPSATALPQVAPRQFSPVPAIGPSRRHWWASHQWHPASGLCHDCSNRGLAPSG